MMSIITLIVQYIFIINILRDTNVDNVLYNQSSKYSLCNYFWPSEEHLCLVMSKNNHQYGFSFATCSPPNCFWPVLCR